MFNKIGISIIAILLQITVINFAVSGKNSPQDTTSKKNITSTIRKLVKEHYSKQDTSQKVRLPQIERVPAEQDTVQQKISAMKKDTVKIIIPSQKKSVQDTVKIEPTVIINNNELYTKTQQVKVNMTAPRGIRMKLSNYEDFHDVKWRPITFKLNWTLLEGNGYKRVYYKLLYPDSTESSVQYDEIILDMTPPVASFTVTPDSGIAGETLFMFDATASRHNFDLFHRWDWENDKNFDTYWNVSKEEVHAFSNGGGKKTVKLEIKDSGGWLVSTTRDIYVFSRPQPQFTVSQNFLRPLEFSFDASATVNEESDEYLEMKWDFIFDTDSTFDTEWSRDKTIIHEYEDFITQSVKLLVKDSRGFTQAW